VTTLTVRPTGTTAIGRVRSGGLLTNYATLKETYAAGSVDNGTGIITLGQWTDLTNLEINEGFFEFSMASLPTTAIVTSAVFEYTMFSSNRSNVCDHQLLAFAAGSITSADWRAASTLSGFTNYGTLSGTTSFAADTTYQASLNAAGRAAVQAASGGTFSMMSASDHLIAGTPPTGNHQYTIRSDDDTTSSWRPALIVTYSEAVGVRNRTGRKLSTMRLVA